MTRRATSAWPYVEVEPTEEEMAEETESGTTSVKREVLTPLGRLLSQLPLDPATGNNPFTGTTLVPEPNCHPVLVNLTST